jgi:hypothetical protein
MKYSFLIFSFCILGTLYSLGLTDFVPDFLLPSRSDSVIASGTPNTPSGLVSNNKASATTSSASKAVYCRNVYNTKMDSVFCNNTKIAESLVVASSDIADNTPITDITSVAPVKPWANQNALQDQVLKNAMSTKYQYVIPLQPNSNMDMNINSNKVQFNIKY